MNIEDFTRGYIAAAIWTSTDDAGEPLDGSTLADETVATMHADCARFLAENATDLETYAIEIGAWDGWSADSVAGHDFWLTRCGHGAGFWDRGLSDLGDRLTAAAKSFGNVDLYIGDDGQVYA